MSIFKCKMCGGTIEFEQGATVGICDSCGTKQTLPRLDDDRRANLYDRANHFRRNNEFDKAAGIYEQILTEDTTDAEAYWSLVLCQYGIEYVEDPATHKRVPTVNRAQFTSIFDDDNYKSALQYADGYQRELYEEEAKTINDIQKGILAISQKEEPFDVFICYKETDNNGRRTPDSVLANDLYHQLTQEGFKVFFARITLEDKLGTAYEPYIFAALNSAKVMVVLGTKPEHFNAVWVKNEWSRYLDLVKKSGGKKILIPAYKDMDPYDLPEEFSHLQAQDMSKLGFMQDLIRGIGKLVPRETAAAQPQVQQAGSAAGANATVASLVERGNMALEDSDWDKATELFNRVLDVDPKNAEAYLGLAMAEAQCGDRISFGKAYIRVYSQLDSSRSVVRAKQFGDMELVQWLESLDEQLRAVREKEAEEERLEEEKREEAARIYREEKSKEKARREQYARLIAFGDTHAAGLRSDGTVVATGDNEDGQCDVSDWNDIVAITAGDYHTVGLRSDGTVVAVGDNEDGQCDVSDWNDIVATAASWSHTVGLKSDGTVVAAGDNEDGQCNVSDWNDIMAIAAATGNTFGLRSDGTVVAVGDNSYGQCDVSDWNDIVAITVGVSHTVGLKSDGTVVAVGKNEDGQCDVSGWSNIMAITAGDSQTVGLKSDGTVVSTDTRFLLSNFSDIVSISASYNCVVGVKESGQVETSFHDRYSCDVSKWKNIVVAWTTDIVIVGLCSDGTVRSQYVKGYLNRDPSYEKYDFSCWKLFKGQAEQESDYTAACAAQNTGTEEQLAKAVTLFASIKDHKDSAERLKKCQEAIRQLQNARKKEELLAEKNRLAAELPTIKGLFSGGKRKQIEARLTEIEEDLKKL